MSNQRETSPNQAIEQLRREVMNQMFNVPGMLGGYVARATQTATNHLPQPAALAHRTTTP